MNTTDKKHVIMICLMETIICSIMNETEPKTRRWNQYKGLLDKLKNVDKTYHGSLSDSEVDQAELVYSKIEELIGGIKL